MNRKQGVILSYILMVFEVFSTLMLTPFIIRTLGQAEYGVYKLAAALTAYLLLLDLGIGNAVTRYVAKFRVENNKEKCEQFLGVATIFYILIGIVCFFAGVVLIALFPSTFSKGLNGEEIRIGQQLLFITMVNAVITLASTAYTNVLIAYEKFAISKGANLFQILVRMLFTSLALIFGLRSIGIVLVNLITTVACKFFYIWYVLFVIKLKPKFRNIDKGLILDIVQYSSLILLQMIATQLNASIDQVLIGSLVDSSSVILGIYGVGTQIVQYFQQIGTAFTGVLMPGIVKLVEEKNSSQVITDEMIRIGRIILIVLMLIWSGFVVEGKQFIELWAGIDNSQAYYVTLILITAYLFIYAESIGTQVLWAMNEHREQSYLKLAIVILNVFLTVILIKWNPLIGATVGTFISLLLGDIFVMNIVFVKKIKMDLLYYYKGLLKGILPCGFIALAAGMVIKMLVPISSWLQLIIVGASITLIYVVLMFTFGMNSYEKKLCFSLIDKFKR